MGLDLLPILSCSYMFMHEYIGSVIIVDFWELFYVLSLMRNLLYIMYVCVAEVHRIIVYFYRLSVL